MENIRILGYEQLAYAGISGITGPTFSCDRKCYSQERLAKIRDRPEWNRVI